MTIKLYSEDGKYFCKAEIGKTMSAELFRVAGKEIKLIYNATNNTLESSKDIVIRHLTQRMYKLQAQLIKYEQKVSRETKSDKE